MTLSHFFFCKGGIRLTHLLQHSRKSTQNTKYQAMKTFFFQTFLIRNGSQTRNTYVFTNSKCMKTTHQKMLISMQHKTITHMKKILFITPAFISITIITFLAWECNQKKKNCWGQNLAVQWTHCGPTNKSSNVVWNLIHKLHYN